MTSQREVAQSRDAARKREEVNQRERERDRDRLRQDKVSAVERKMCLQSTEVEAQKHYISSGTMHYTRVIDAARMAYKTSELRQPGIDCCVLLRATKSEGSKEPEGYVNKHFQTHGALIHEKTARVTREDFIATIRRTDIDARITITSHRLATLHHFV